jgi:Na+/H+-dicarboxylate symporter
MFDIIPSSLSKGRSIFMIDTASGFLKSLSGRLDSLVKDRLWLKVIIGLILGIVVGALLGPDLDLISPEKAAVIGDWLALPGKLFLGLIGMVVSILVLASIIIGLNNSTGGSQLRSVGIKFTIFVVVTTTLAAGLGISLGLAIKPGSYVHIQLSENEPKNVKATSPGQESTRKSIPQMIADLIPQKPLASLATGEMLGIVVFAILIGIACTSANREKISSFLSFMEALMEVSMIVVKWAMLLAPLAVFGLMAQLISKVGLATILGLGVYILTVLVGLACLLVLYLVLVTVLGRANPFEFASKITSAQLLAFSTSSTAAVMPLSIKTAVEKLKVPENISGLIIPLAATVNMAGTALYQAVAIIFLAQLSGLQLSYGELSLIVVTLVASSIGAPGTPGVGLVILGNIAGDFGIPTEGLVLILGVDRILDMCRTAVNVTGDLAACVILGSEAPIQERLTSVELTEDEAKTIPV